MELVSIFVDKLYAIQFDGEDANEYDRLLDLWNDTEYVRGFLKENQSDLFTGTDIGQFAIKINQWAEDIEETIDDLATNNKKTLDTFFVPLDNYVYQSTVELSKRKGRTMVLRLYAIRVDKNLFVITGGAIKLTQFMEDRPHTQLELDKLARGKAFLEEQGVFDAGSFEEFIIERYDD